MEQAGLWDVFIFSNQKKIIRRNQLIFKLYFVLHKRLRFFNLMIAFSIGHTDYDVDQVILFIYLFFFKAKEASPEHPISENLLTLSQVCCNSCFSKLLGVGGSFYHVLWYIRYKNPILRLKIPTIRYWAAYTTLYFSFKLLTVAWFFSKFCLHSASEVLW